jgi:hypothetical protein
LINQWMKKQEDSEICTEKKYDETTSFNILAFFRIPFCMFSQSSLILFQKFSALLLMRLAYQSLGVVYGDLGTSPLYVFYNTFPHGVDNSEDVIGALSLIIYSLTLVPLLKYVFIVLRANDNGQGIYHFPSFWFISILII